MSELIALRKADAIMPSRGKFTVDRVYPLGGSRLMRCRAAIREVPKIGSLMDGGKWMIARHRVVVRHWRRMYIIVRYVERQYPCYAAG